MNSIRIPPNWTNVKKSNNPLDKIQVTGYDKKNRKQYIYHPLWTFMTSKLKYNKNINFSRLNKILKYDSETSFCKDYVLSNMIIIMQKLNIRTGNEIYKKENGSIGLCTLCKKHYKNNKLIFIGKKGILHEKKIEDNTILNFINKMLKISGDNLFQYSTNTPVKAQDLNDYLQKKIDKNLTCKDIRTYQANKIFKNEIKKLLKNKSTKNYKIKKLITMAIKSTSIELGNTPKVCRDSYINPEIISYYLSKEDNE